METLEAIEQLEALYEKSLVLPQEKREHKILLCPVGHVASGKTTVIKPLSEMLHLVRISTDELRVLARDNDIPCHEHVVAFNLVRKYLAEGYSIACDFDCSSLEAREFLEAESLLHHAKVLFLKVNPPQAWIMNKIQKMNYSEDGLFKDISVGLAEIERSFTTMTFPDIEYACEFDTSSPSLPASVASFAKQIS